MHDHYAAFKSNYKQTFEQTHGFWREVVDRVVQQFLECGDLAKGFARIGACGCGKEHLLPFSCKTFLRTQLGLPDGEVGMILVIHTFGEYLGWHPHLHILCADGLFRQSGLFQCMRPVDLQELELLFRGQKRGHFVNS